MFKKLIEFFSELALAGYEFTYSTVSSYLSFLKSAGIWSLFTSIGLSILIAVGVIADIPWLYKFAGDSVIIIGCLFFTLTLPLGFVVAQVYQEVASFRRAIEMYAGAIFFILSFAVLFHLVPIWKYPEALFLSVMVIVSLTAAYFAFGYKVSAKLTLIRNWLILGATVLSCLLPVLPKIAEAKMLEFNESLSTNFLGPEEVTYSPNMTFFNSTDSRPVIWFDARPDGTYKLYNRPGYDKTTGNKLKPINNSVIKILEEGYKKEKAEVKKVVTPAVKQDAVFKESEKPISKIVSEPAPYSLQSVQVKPRPVSSYVVPNIVIGESLSEKSLGSGAISIPVGTEITARSISYIRNSEIRPGIYLQVILENPIVSNGITVCGKYSEAKAMISRVSYDSVNLQLSEITTVNSRKFSVNTYPLELKTGLIKRAGINSEIVIGSSNSSAGVTRGLEIKPDFIFNFRLSEAVQIQQNNP